MPLLLEIVDDWDAVDQHGRRFLYEEFVSEMVECDWCGSYIAFGWQERSIKEVCCDACVKVVEHD